MTSDSHSHLVQALTLWREITGVDPNAKSIRVSDWHLHETFEELQEAIELDPSQVTASLLLSFFANSYLTDSTVSRLDLLKDPARIAASLEKPRALLAILERPEMLEAREIFTDAIKAALATYGAAERADVQALLAENDNVAILRRDALRSIANLRVDQFLDGEPEAEGYQPIYNRVVHQWWNVNSMLAAATRMPSGVSLNLIRHPDAFQSFFCFTIRNGGNLFVLTDVPDADHPLQAYMTRRPDRDFSRRAQKNWFPYGLLDLAYDEDSGRLYVKKSEGRGVVAYQPDTLVLKPLAELEPPEVVWITMMFDLIIERFWRRGHKAPSLSYTAEMLQSENVLLEYAKSSNLPVPAYQPIGLAPLTKADVRSDAVTEEEVGEKHSEPNRWMEERYAHLVSDEALNLLAAPEQVFTVNRKTGDVELMLPGYHKLSDWEKREKHQHQLKVDKVDATSFGSRERISADRKFIARANFASQIYAHALEEYEARHKEVMAWYKERVAANAQTLLRWCGNEELWVNEGQHSYFSHYEGPVGQSRSLDVAGHEDDHWRPPKRYIRTFLKRYDLETAEDPYIGGFTLGKYNRSGMRPLCYLNESKASYWAVFFPATPEELALLAGCAVSELPDVLQHWRLFSEYRGNCILSRQDPLHWKCRNPWIELRMPVRIALSKRGLAQLLKQPIVKPDLPTLIDTPK